MYTVNFKGKTYPVSGPTFWSLTLPLAGVVLAVFCWAVWMLYLTSTMLADITGIPAFLCGVGAVLLVGALTVNGVEKAFLPAPVRAWIGRGLVCATLYYQYAVLHESLAYVALLAAPALIAMTRKLLLALKAR